MPRAGEGDLPAGCTTKHNQTSWETRGTGVPPRDSGRNKTLSTCTKWFSHQWNTSELKPRGVWHRSACEIQTSGCQIGTIADTGETAAESLGSMFLMRNTCVHIQKILQYSTDKKFKLLSGKKITKHLQVGKTESMLIFTTSNNTYFSLLRAIFNLYPSHISLLPLLCLAFFKVSWSSITFNSERIKLKHYLNLLPFGSSLIL